MKKPINLYCSCGAIVGQQVFSHNDPRMRGFGSPDGAVYKNVYNGKEARRADGMLIPLRGNQYMCKKCQAKKGN